MKIIFIINSLSERAGTERVACQLANELSLRYDYDITIVNRTVDADDIPYSFNQKIKIKKINGNLFSFYKRLRIFLIQKKPKYVVIHNMGKLSIFCSFLNLKKIKFISLEHVSFLSRNIVIRFLSRIFYKKFFAIISITKNDLNIYREWHRNVYFIPNFSSFNRKHNYYQSSSKKIIAVGRLTSQKNFQLLIESWSNIQQCIPEGWELHIYGDGEEKESLVNLIRKKEVSHSIFLDGNISEIENVYKSASFLVMSSKYEGLPMVLIEAQCFGIPVVSFDCPTGPAEIIDNNVNGILVENQNIDALSKAMIQLVYNPDLRMVLSSNAFSYAKKYSAEIILEKWNNILSI